MIKGRLSYNQFRRIGDLFKSATVNGAILLFIGVMSMAPARAQDARVGPPTPVEARGTGEGAAVDTIPSASVSANVRVNNRTGQICA